MESNHLKEQLGASGQWHSYDNLPIGVGRYPASLSDNGALYPHKSLPDSLFKLQATQAETIVHFLSQNLSSFETFFIPCPVTSGKIIYQSGLSRSHDKEIRAYHKSRYGDEKLSVFAATKVVPSVQLQRQVIDPNKRQNLSRLASLRHQYPNKAFWSPFSFKKELLKRLEKPQWSQGFMWVVPIWEQNYYLPAMRQMDGIVMTDEMMTSRYAMIELNYAVASQYGMPQINENRPSRFSYMKIVDEDMNDIPVSKQVEKLAAHIYEVTDQGWSNVPAVLQFLAYYGYDRLYQNGDKTLKNHLMDPVVAETKTGTERHKLDALFAETLPYIKKHYGDDNEFNQALVWAQNNAKAHGFNGQSLCDFWQQATESKTPNAAPLVSKPALFQISSASSQPRSPIENASRKPDVYHDFTYPNVTNPCPDPWSQNKVVFNKVPIQDLLRETILTVTGGVQLPYATPDRALYLSNPKQGRIVETQAEENNPRGRSRLPHYDMMAHDPHGERSLAEKSQAEIYAAKAYMLANHKEWLKDRAIGRLMTWQNHLNGIGEYVHKHATDLFADNQRSLIWAKPEATRLCQDMIALGMVSHLIVTDAQWISARMMRVLHEGVMRAVGLSHNDQDHDHVEMHFYRDNETKETLPEPMKFSEMLIRHTGLLKHMVDTAQGPEDLVADIGQHFWVNASMWTLYEMVTDPTTRHNRYVKNHKNGTVEKVDALDPRYSDPQFLDGLEGVNDMPRDGFDLDVSLDDASRKITQSKHFQDFLNHRGEIVISEDPRKRHELVRDMHDWAHTMTITPHIHKVFGLDETSQPPIYGAVRLGSCVNLRESEMASLPFEYHQAKKILNHRASQWQPQRL